VHRGLLVTYENVLKLVLLEDLVVDVQDSASGIPEDVGDSFVLQTTYNDLGAGELHFANPLKVHWKLMGCRSLPTCGERRGGRFWRLQRDRLQSLSFVLALQEGETILQRTRFCKSINGLRPWTRGASC
jgi:hypothetical protein